MSAGSSLAGAIAYDTGAGATTATTIRIRLSDEDRLLLDGLEAALGSLEGYVDGLEALATTLNSNVDGLEALATTLNGFVDGLEGFTDGLEGTLTSLDTKAVQMALDFGVPAGAVRVAALLGNATGLADFGGGVTTAQTLRIRLSDEDRALVDGLEGFVDGLEGFTDGLEALLTSIGGYVDGLEGFTDGLEGSLNNLDTKAVQMALDFGASTGGVRVAAQLGNATGSLDYNDGASSAQTLRVSANLQRDGNDLSYGSGAVDANTQRVVLPTDQPAIPVTPGKLSVVDFIDVAVGPVLDAAVNNIQDNAGAFTTLIASTAAAAKAIRVSDTTGLFIGIYTGAAASEVLAFIINPGMDDIIEHAIPATARISVRAMGTADITAGELCLQLLA